MIGVQKKNPVIFPCDKPQWFASIRSFREQILELLKKGELDTTMGMQRLYNMCTWSWRLRLFLVQTVRGVYRCHFIWWRTNEPNYHTRNNRHVAKYIWGVRSNVCLNEQPLIWLPAGIYTSVLALIISTKENDIMDVCLISGSSRSSLKRKSYLSFPGKICI